VLCDKLGKVILPLYAQTPDDFAKIVGSAIALNASTFNTQQVVSQYRHNAYHE
jgi:hypothetical protein